MEYPDLSLRDPPHLQGRHFYSFEILNFETGLGSRSLSRSRGRSEPGDFCSLEPEPLEQKTSSRCRSRLEKKSGAGATKNLAGSSALRENKKHKEIVHLLLFFR